MAHQVIWTDKLTEDFCRLAMLSEEESFIIKTRARGYTISYQAMQLNRSEAWVHKCVANLKKKYDNVQKEHPDKFPLRRISKTEDFMDAN